MGIACKTWIGAERLIESRLDNALSIGHVQPCIADCALRNPQRVGAADARYHARAKGRVIFGTGARIERQPGHGLPLQIEETRLVVAAHVETDKSVFDFVLVTCGNAESLDLICRLCHKAGAVILNERRKKLIEVKLAIIRLSPA